jgi:hypothetical protein
VVARIDDRVSTARRIIDSNSYLTLATADASGRPWATPVWFAHECYTDYVWVSRPSTRHSANLATARVGHRHLRLDRAGRQRARGLHRGPRSRSRTAESSGHWPTFSAALEADGGTGWQLADVTGSAAFRLYHARASSHFLLDDHDHRVPVDPTTA